MERNNRHTAKIIGEILLEKSLSISIAESVTEGCLQNSFYGIPYANEFFQGGIVVANIGENTQIKNPLSEAMAIQMAQQVTELFSSSVGVGIAGYHSSSEKNTDNHFAYCAVVVNGKVIISKKLRSQKTKNIGKNYCEKVLKMLMNALKTVNNTQA